MEHLHMDDRTWQRLREKAEVEKCSINALLTRYLDQDAAGHIPSTFPTEQLIENLPLAVAMFDTEMCYLQANRAWREQYRLGDIDLLGRSHYEIFPEIDDDWKQIHQRCLHGEVNINACAPFPREDGSLDWVRWEVRPWYLDHTQTRIGGITMYTEVITERINAERALSEAEERYRTVADFSMDWTYWERPDGTVQYVSPVCELISGVPAQEIYDNPQIVRQMIHEEDRLIWDAHRHDFAAAADRDKRQIFFRIRHRDGSIRWIEHICRPVFREDGTFDGYRASNTDVTLLKHNEALLQDKERTLSLALQAAQAGVWRWDMPTDHLQWDATMEAIYGLEPGTFRGQNNHWESLVHPDDREKVIAEVMHALVHEDYVNSQYRIIRPDGVTRHVLAQALLLRDEATGEVTQVIGINRDVTEHKEMEAELHSSKERYRLLSDLTFEGIVLHHHGVVRDANPAFLGLFGYEREEIIGQQVIDKLFSPESVQLIRENIKKSYASAYEVMGVRKDGSQFPIELEARQVGSELRVVSVRDISRRKAIEATLKERDLLFEIAFNSSPDAININRINDGLYIDVNNGFMEIMGYARDEVVGKTSLELNIWKHPEDRQRLVRELLRDGVVDALEAEFCRKDGGTVVGLMSARILKYSGEDVILSVTRDITEYKSNQQLKQDYERLAARFQKEQQQNALIQRIISMLSHDLRIPLSVIYTSKDILTRYYDRMDAEKRLEKLDTIGRQVQFALELLEDTVSIARGSAGDQPFQPAPVNIVTLCQVSVNEIRVADQEHHVIRFINESDLEIVRLDEVLVSRILLNLLSNAIKYSPEGSEIRLRLDYQDDWLFLHVVDGGIGISEIDLPHIFDPFYRANNVGRVNGSGLGLSIVKDCVERHHGSIEVESKPGQGSQFTVKLPLAPVAQPASVV